MTLSELQQRWNGVEGNLKASEHHLHARYHDHRHLKDDVLESESAWAILLGHHQALPFRGPHHGQVNERTNDGGLCQDLVNEGDDLEGLNYDRGRLSSDDEVEGLGSGGENDGGEGIDHDGGI